MTRPVFVVVLVFAGSPAAGQPPAPLPAEPPALRGESGPTRKRLAEAEAKLRGGKPADAADDLQRLLDEAGDDLVTLDGRHYRPARWVAHQLLAQLPADALRAYQARVDEPARLLLAAGTRDRDPAPLWHLLDRFFVSKPAADGLLLLGDLLFERGEFRTAEGVWRRLLPDGGADAAHPTPPADLAPVRARAVLAATFAGELDRARVELAAFRRQHPTAAGPFAGKTGPLADALQGYLDRPPPGPVPVNSGLWPMYGGDPARSGRVGGPLPHHWPSRPTWTATLPVEGVAPTRPFGHPVIADGKVFVSDGRRVLVYDLRTGRASAASSPFEPAAAVGGDGAAAVAWAGGRLFARLGPATVRLPLAPRAGGKPPDESALASFAPPANPGRAAPAVREVWRVPPPAGDGKRAVWDGGPLPADGRLWSAVARFEDGRVVQAVACYDPGDPAAAPDRPAWVTDLTDAPAPGPDGRPRQELLTRAGRHVVLCTNGGAVVAVDAVTGRRAWAYLYPRAPRKPDAPRLPPDPAPAVAHGGRVFVAPVDADRVFCLDADTGRPLWESGRADGARMLGVSRGRLIVTTAGPVKGIRALSATTGSYRGGDGWLQADGGGVPGFGQGLVSDDAVAWPTRGGLYFLDPDTGRPLAAPLRPPPDGTFGNLAYADGVLVVVTPAEVMGYVAEYTPAPRPPAPPPDPRPRWEAVSEPRPPSPAVPFDLSPAAGIVRTVRLPAFSQPLRPIPGGGPPRHLFAGTPAGVVAVAVGSRAVTRHPTADAYTHAADLPGGFVAAGPAAVAVFDGGPAPAWVYRPPGDELSSFALAGAWLVARLGDRHLVALDLPGRRLAWVLGAHGRPRFEPLVFPSCPRFGEHLYASARVVVVQLGDGRRWAVQTATGRVYADHGAVSGTPLPDAGEPTARGWWVSPPVGLGGRVLFSDGPGRVRLAGPVGGRVVWEWDAGGEPSLAGDPPQARVWGDDVFVAVRRNHGVEVSRLDAADGSPAWSCGPAFLDADRVDLRHADADADRLYLPAGGKLVALHRDGGKPAWEADLPPLNGAAGWAVRAGPRAVVVYPVEAVPAEPTAVLLRRLWRSLLREPAGWRLPWLAVAAYDGWAGRAAPVLVLDPETGERLTELTVPTDGPGVEVAAAGDTLAVAAGGRVAWVR